MASTSSRARGTAQSQLSANMADRAVLLERFAEIRNTTERIASPLTPEDQQVQSMPDVSPTKWHLAHVTWFFETFLLKPEAPGYTEFHPRYNYLFNSYYEGVGPRHARPRRGLLTRPSLADVMDYRAHVTDAMLGWLEGCADGALAARAWLVELGLHHEQQHQELALMDIKHVFSCNPMAPAYRTVEPADVRTTHDLAWFDVDGGLYGIGFDSEAPGAGFAFDNEGPRHEVRLEDFRIASRPVTNAEFAEFVEDGGYRRPEFWHSDGWTTVNAKGWDGPLYWRDTDGRRDEFTLSGLCALYDDAPVCHVSYYEAAAYAAWAGRRLPTEAEWEVAARRFGTGTSAEGGDESKANLLASGFLRPMPAGPANAARPSQMVGDVWEWTASAYAPYPGFRVADGAVGEYNGKFMVNQMVLRGGACVTPPGHVRLSYRNFFYPHQRWAFSGFRLAE